jgi:phage replication O-like protein O
MNDGLSENSPFTKIPNDLLGELCRTRISGEDRQILDVIIRLTIGWQKREASIELKDFVGMTGLRKSSILRSLQRLGSRNIIIVLNSENAKAKKYKINKDITKWKSFSNSRMAKKGMSFSKMRINVLKNENKRSQIREQTVLKNENANGGKSTTGLNLPMSKEILKKYKEKKKKENGGSGVPSKNADRPPYWHGVLYHEGRNYVAHTEADSKLFARVKITDLLIQKHGLSRRQVENGIFLILPADERAEVTL